MLLRSQEKEEEEEKKEFRRKRIRRKSQRLKNLWNSQTERSTIEETKRREREEKKGKKGKKEGGKKGGTKQTSAVHQATNSEVVCSRGGSCTGARPGGCVDAGRGKMNSTKGESNCQRSRTWRPFRPRHASFSSFRYRLRLVFVLVILSHARGIGTPRKLPSALPRDTNAYALLPEICNNVSRVHVSGPTDLHKRGEVSFAAGRE